MKYRNNRSVLLDQVLEKYYYEKDNESEQVDFSMWFPYKPKPPVEAKVDLYLFETMTRLNNKRYIASKLQNSDAKEFIPETLFTQEEIDCCESNGLWFLKHESTDEGKNVWCYKTSDDLKKFTTRKGVLDKYIVQKEVQSLDTIVGHKYSLRVYLVVVNGECFVYDEVMGKLHPREYDENNMSRDIHIESTEGSLMFRCSTLPNWRRIQENVYKCLKEVVKVFQNDWNEFDESKTNYMIIGVDIILDLFLKPYFIEFNTFPYLYDNRPDARKFKLEFLENFYEFLIKPALANNYTGYHAKFVPV